MARVHSIDGILSYVSSLDKGALVEKIKGFKGNFEMDFTDEYYNGASVDRLRHIYLRALTSTIKRE